MRVAVARARVRPTCSSSSCTRALAALPVADVVKVERLADDDLDRHAWVERGVRDPGRSSASRGAHRHACSRRESGDLLAVEDDEPEVGSIEPQDARGRWSTCRSRDSPTRPEGLAAAARRIDAVDRLDDATCSGSTIPRGPGSASSGARPRGASSRHRSTRLASRTLAGESLGLARLVASSEACLRVTARPERAQARLDGSLPAALHHARAARMKRQPRGQVDRRTAAAR